MPLCQLPGGGSGSEGEAERALCTQLGCSGPELPPWVSHRALARAAARHQCPPLVPHPEGALPPPTSPALPRLDPSAEVLFPPEPCSVSLS